MAISGGRACVSRKIYHYCRKFVVYYTRYRFPFSFSLSDFPPHKLVLTYVMVCIPFFRINEGNSSTFLSGVVSVLTRVGVQVPHDLVERSESTKTLEVRQSNRHFWFMVVILVQVGPLGVKPLSQSLATEIRQIKRRDFIGWVPPEALLVSFRAALSR